MIPCIQGSKRPTTSLNMAIKNQNMVLAERMTGLQAAIKTMGVAIPFASFMDDEQVQKLKKLFAAELIAKVSRVFSDVLKNNITADAANVLYDELEMCLRKKE